MAERKPLAARKRIQKQKPTNYVASRAEEPESTPDRIRPANVPKKKRVVRMPLSTRVRYSLRELMDEYESATGTGVQEMVETALTEYLAQRGYFEAEGE